VVKHNRGHYNILHELRIRLPTFEDLIVIIHSLTGPNTVFFLPQLASIIIIITNYDTQPKAK
jgi:hypothetical protein